MTQQPLLNKYKRLTEIEHIRKRSGMYLGSIVKATSDVYVYDPNKKRMKLESLTFSPALLKLFDEIISNSVDEHIRSGNVTKIMVTISPLTGEIIIEDNGGIPVKIHPEYGVYIPSMVFGELRTGSNFSDDERTTLGLNGLGVKLAAVFSTSFKVETCDGQKQFVQVFEDGLTKKHDPVIRNCTDPSRHGTRITFTPDYTALNCDLDQDAIKRITKRVYDVAGCNPKIKVYLNGDLIKINKFSDYVHLYVEDAVEDSNKDWQIAVGPTKDDQFHQISFVNGGDTYNGGSHVDYIANQIAYKLRDTIKKKHKVDVKPGNIKQQLFLFINCRINAPIFTSQTKEFMSSNVKDFGTEFEVSDQFISKLMKSPIVEEVLNWVEAQERKAELEEQRKLNKKNQANNALKKIIKFDDATSKVRQECSLFIVEGDSAATSVLSNRDPKLHGVFSLRGKPLNVRDVKIRKLVANTEFSNLMTILGLKLGDESISSLREVVVEVGGKEYLAVPGSVLIINGERFEVPS